MGRRKKSQKIRSKKNKKKYFRVVKSREMKSDRCANPFKFKRHKGKGLRVVSKSLLDRLEDFSPLAKICGQCRKHETTASSSTNRSRNNQNVVVDQRLYEFSNVTNATVEEDTSSQEPSTSAGNLHHDEIQGSNVATRNESRNTAEASDFKLIFENLKASFSSLSNNDPLRIRILTIVPNHWTLKRTAEEFGTTVHYVRRARELLANAGLFAEVSIKLGKRLTESTVETISAFYNNDEVSRVMPSTKDCVTMKIGGKKQRVQKRMLLLSLKELYALFKTEHSDVKVSFSMFAKHRPKNCILPGQSGTHSVCVCTIHQNVKTMLDAIDLQNLTANEETKLKDYKDCLKKIMCLDTSDDCFFNNCKSCPGITTFGDYLKELLSKNSVLEVKYAVWTETDRSTLVNHLENVEDFVDNLCDRLEKLKPHSHISKKQSNFIKQRKINLSEGEVVVCFDFSENYAYVVQDAAQSFHYNNDQCTVFPVIYYFRRKSEVVHRSCIFISESTKHDSAAVYVILTKLIPVIKRDVGKKVKKIIYVSDGAKQHFKNRYQMSNLRHHKEDFNIDAEWHFTPTAHGKSGHDGLAACFKREARRTSLKVKPTDAILNANSLFTWAKQYFKEVRIFKFSQVEHSQIQRKLNKRFAEAERVTGIMSHHFFKVLENGMLEMRHYSTI